MSTLYELVQRTKQKLGHDDAEIVWCLLQSDHPENGMTDEDVTTAAYMYFSDGVWGKHVFKSTEPMGKVLELIPHLSMQGDAFKSAFNKFSKLLAGCALWESGDSSDDMVYALASCCLLDSVPLKRLGLYGISISKECSLTFGDLMAVAVLGDPPIFSARTFLQLFSTATARERNWEDLTSIGSNLLCGTGLKNGARVPAPPWVRGTWQDIGAAARHITRWGSRNWYRFAETSDGYVSIMFFPIVKDAPECAGELGLPYKDWGDFCSDCAATGKQSVTVVFDYKPQKETEMFTLDPIEWHTKGLRAVLDQSRDLCRWTNTDTLGQVGWRITAPIIGADGSVQLDASSGLGLYSDANGTLHFITRGRPQASSFVWSLKGDLGESSKLQLEAQASLEDVDDCINLIKAAIGVYVPALSNLLPQYTFSSPDLSIEVHKQGPDGIDIRITRIFPGVRFDVIRELECSASKLAQWQVLNDECTGYWYRLSLAGDCGIHVTTDSKDMVPCRATVGGYELRLAWIDEELRVSKMEIECS